MAADLLDIGWWIMSVDEEIYGPASRAILRRFLGEGIISPHTLVRHSTHPEPQPVADVPRIRDGLSSQAPFSTHGDRLAEAWPRRRKERLALAEDTLPCAWKNRPAVLVCLRCGAPYCGTYRMKPLNRQFYFCKSCQRRVYNRRTFAYFLDVFASYLFMIFLPVTLITVVFAMLNDGQTETMGLRAALVALTGVWTVLFVLRDRLFRGAGPGKRLFGLHVVSFADGMTRLSGGQAFLRWLPLQIPFFNLVDASVGFRDPLMRRYGDRWAGTRVVDMPGKLAKDRFRVITRLAKKGVELENPIQTPMSEFARFAE